MRASARTAAPRGMGLIELMVALALGMLLSLGVFAMLGAGEGHKRATTAVNDANQEGSYAMFLLDRLVRGAGAGFATGGRLAFGCALHAARGGRQVLPATAPLPAPFATVNPGAPGLFRLAPLLIAPGQTLPPDSGQPSDALVVMSGHGGSAAYPVEFRGAATDEALDLPNTLGFAGGDLVLVAEEDKPGCMVQQVRDGFVGDTSHALPLGGEHAAARIADAAAAGYSSAAAAMNLGNAAQGHPPTFWLLGVGEHNTLYSYDLLQLRGTVPRAEPVADGVFELHALYGVDPTDGGNVNWASPASPGYDIASLTAGTPAAAERLRSIKAVRLALVLRTPLREGAPVASPSLTLFDGLADAAGQPLRRTRALSEAERRYRYRVIESTIPIRNNML